MVFVDPHSLDQFNVLVQPGIISLHSISVYKDLSDVALSSCSSEESGEQNNADFISLFPIYLISLWFALLSVCCLTACSLCPWNHSLFRPFCAFIKILNVAQNGHILISHVFLNSCLLSEVSWTHLLEPLLRGLEINFFFFVACTSRRSQWKSAVHHLLLHHVFVMEYSINSVLPVFSYCYLIWLSSEL